jgi:hypothetical protein
MANTKASAFTSITPVLADEFIMTDDPGGSPANARATGTAVLTLLKASTDTYYYGTANVSYVAADFSSTEDTTLTNITGLTFTTASGGVYRFKAMLFINCHASGGTKIAISGTNTATGILYHSKFITLVWANSEDFLSTALDEAEGDTAQQTLVEIYGYIDVNEGGTLTVQFAQNASNGTASTVLAGSWFEVDKIG